MDIQDFKVLGNRNNWWFTGKRELVASLLEQHKDKKIVTIGCGTGEDFKTFSKYGELFGLDNDFETLKQVPKKYSDKIIHGDARKTGFKRNTFDVVLLLDVLEHIEEDKKVIKEVRRILKKDGTIIATVPACKFLWSQHDIALGHQRRYSKESIKELFKNTKIKMLSYWNSLMFLPITILKLAKLNMYTRSPKVDTKKLPAILDYLFLSILRLENLLIMKGITLPIGISFVVVAKKGENEKDN